jgi:poly-gamma-glutamate synthesis protein (capsule biosynthesis protein)
VNRVAFVIIAVIVLSKAQEVPQSIPHMLSAHHITAAQFAQSVNHPRHYDIDGVIRAGVVPHHTTAASMISGFFVQAAKHAHLYDTVVIVAPNHEGDLGDIILSDRDWDMGGGVVHDRAFVSGLLEAATGLNIFVHNERLEQDHSAAVLIPYIHHYLPDANVVTVLVSPSLGYDGVGALARLIVSVAGDLQREILLVCSIDFSHFLLPHEVSEKDRVTEQAVINRDYRKIYSLCSQYLDSPAAMIVFLMVLEAYGLELIFVDNAEASQFMGFAIDETTSYFVMAGVE